METCYCQSSALSIQFGLSVSLENFHGDLSDDTSTTYLNLVVLELKVVVSITYYSEVKKKTLSGEQFILFG